MPLTGKYLKYQPEITFDIFKLVWDRLLELGWRENSNSSIKSRWVEFTGKYPYFRHTTKKEFNTHEDSGGRIETTVQEILGYDPFVKEENEVTKEKVIEKVIPEYVECIKPQFWVNTIKDNNGNLIFDTKSFKFSYYSGTWEEAIGNSGNSHFKPSTKEAFDAQNQPKSIEKWSVGSYIVFLQDRVLTRSGKVTKGKPYELETSGRCPYFRDDSSTPINFDSQKYELYGLKWFATKSEAEEFAKTLVEPVKCGNGILDRIEPKQPLRQAVHCKTQEEWDFVSDKIGYKFATNFKLGHNDTININSNTCECKRFYDNSNYNLVSFQEWRDLNGYKMGKEVKFEIGKWYKYENWYIKYLKHDDGIWTASEYINDTESYRNFKANFGGSNSDSEKTLASIEEIQQYLPEGHPDKITPVIQQIRDMQKSNQEFKSGDWVFANGLNHTRNNPSFPLNIPFKILEVDKSSFKEHNYYYVRVDKIACPNYVGSCTNDNSIRHATPEEINNHLISIGQIPAGEPLNTGIEPNKDDSYNCISVNRGGNPQCTFNSIKINGQEILKPKMILSIDNEELPMVNIIKTNTIVQLLNND